MTIALTHDPRNRSTLSTGESCETSHIIFHATFVIGNSRSDHGPQWSSVLLEAYAVKYSLTKRIPDLLIPVSSILQINSQISSSGIDVARGVRNNAQEN